MPERFIAVRNKSDAPKRYGLVASPISPDTDANGLPAYECLYKVSKKIASPKGSVVFKISDPMVAVCGIAEEGLKPGARLDASDWASIEAATAGSLGSRVSMRVAPGHAPTFDLSATTKNVEGVGRWIMKAEPGFDLGGSTDVEEEPPFIGYGLADANDPNDIVPLVIWEAQPGAVYVVRCESRWTVYCLTDDKVGDHYILAMNGGAMLQSPQIDFRNKTATYVEVVHQSENVFDITDFD
ncbi:hypothetical protein ACLMJK_000104 [Lecanora helva]